MQRVTQVVGWANLMMAIYFAGMGIFLPADGMALGILALAGSGLYMFAGWSAHFGLRAGSGAMR